MTRDTRGLGRRDGLKGVGATGVAATAGCVDLGGLGGGGGGPYEIGMVDSQTGSLSAFGERNQRGRELALSAVNDLGTAIVMVEQNAVEGLGIADRGYVLDQGAVRFVDDADALLDNPEVGQLYLGG